LEIEPKSIDDLNQSLFFGWKKPNQLKVQKVLIVLQTDYIKKLLKDDKNERTILITIEDPPF